MNSSPSLLPASIAAHLAAGSPLHLREEPIEMLTRSFEDHTKTVKETLTKSAGTVASLSEQVTALGASVKDLEQKAAREPGEGGLEERKSLGQLVVADAGVADAGVAAMTPAFRGKAAVRFERKAITSGTSTVGTTPSPGTSLVPADRRPEIIAPAARRLFIRDLIAATETTSGAIEYPCETGYTNNAKPVAEGTSKPYSDLTFDIRTTQVRTIAHLFKASRQILDDAPALAGYIDARGRYGLALKEENQIFFGDGTGQNLSGLVPQARTYETARTATGDTELDILLHAISQVEEADLPATGIVLSVRDWRQLLGLKDLGKNYLSGGPFGTTEARIWDLPVYPTNTFATGQFLVGAFNSGGAQIFDRMEVEVLVSTENEDDFVKNMATIRIEERLAFATYRPEAFVRGLLR